MKILENSKIVFFIAIVLGFSFPQLADDFKILLVPLLIVMMTLSIKDVHIGHFNKRNYKHMIRLVLINYFVLSPIYLILAYLFIDIPMYRYGFIILAAVPPAAAVIPLAHLYHGDIKDSILGEIACYLFALVFSPMLVYFLLGQTIDIWIFVRLLFLIILLPVLFGRILQNVPINVNHQIVINVIFGFSFYIFIGLNRNIFVNEYRSLISVAVIIFVATFGLAFVIFELLKMKKVRLAQDIMYVLFGTFKNGNGAATIALLLFGPTAVIPVAVRGLMTPFYFIYLEKLFHKHKKILK